MNRRTKGLLTNIVYSFSVIFYLVIGIGVFTISHYDFSDKTVLLSVLIMLSSVPHLLIFIANRQKKSYLIIGLVGIAFGILFMATDIFTADEICMIWGVIDICRGTTEIINVAPTVMKNKVEFVEIAISVGDIVIGVLLCIHMADGLQLHLIYLGIAFIITAIKTVAEFFAERYRDTHHEGIDNN